MKQWYYGVIERHKPGDLVARSSISRMHVDDVTGGIGWCVLAYFENLQDARIWQRIWRRLRDKTDARLLLERNAP